MPSPTPKSSLASCQSSEIEANGFNLNISRYVQTGADAEVVDVAAEVAKLQDLIVKRNAAKPPCSSTSRGSAMFDVMQDSWQEARLGNLVGIIAQYRSR